MDGSPTWVPLYVKESRTFSEAEFISKLCFLILFATPSFFFYIYAYLSADLFSRRGFSCVNRTFRAVVGMFLCENYNCVAYRHIFGMGVFGVKWRVFVYKAC